MRDFKLYHLALVGLSLLSILLLGISEASGQTKKPAHAHKSAKPECEAGEMMGSSDGYTSQWYNCENGKWVRDFKGEKEAAEALAKYEQHHVELRKALTTRALTDEELNEVLAEGYQLLVQSMWPYDPEMKMKEFNGMLATQAILRGQLLKPCKEGKGEVHDPAAVDKR